MTTNGTHLSPAGSPVRTGKDARPVTLYDPQSVPPPGKAGRILGIVTGLLILAKMIVPLGRYPNPRYAYAYSEPPTSSVLYDTVWTWTPILDAARGDGDGVWVLWLSIAATAAPFWRPSRGARRFAGPSTRPVSRCEGSTTRAGGIATSTSGTC